MKIFFFKNHLDIHFHDIINKNVIFHIRYINIYSFKTFFDMLQVKLEFSLISRICTLWVRGKQKVSGFFSR